MPKFTLQISRYLPGFCTGISPVSCLSEVPSGSPIGLVVTMYITEIVTINANYTPHQSVYIYIYIAYNRYYCFYLLVFNKIIQNYVKPLLIILFYFNPIRIYDEFVVRFIAITLNTRLTICKHLIKGEIIQTSNLYGMKRFA